MYKTCIEIDTQNNGKRVIQIFSKKRKACDGLVGSPSSGHGNIIKFLESCLLILWQTVLLFLAYPLDVRNKGHFTHLRDTIITLPLKAVGELVMAFWISSIVDNGHCYSS